MNKSRKKTKFLVLLTMFCSIQVVLMLTPLGYIPIGSSNDFARSLKLSTDALKALDQILKPSAYKTVSPQMLLYLTFSVVFSSIKER